MKRSRRHEKNAPRSRVGAVALAAVTAVLLSSACAGPAHFVDSEADLAYYERVAVAPFSSLAQDQIAGVKVADVFFTELLRTGFAQVSEPGQVAAAMSKVRGGTPITNAWSTEDLAKLGEELGVQGVFFGTVRDYMTERVGRDAFPQISLETRLVDTTSGRIVWTASKTRRGGPGFPIFGFGEVHTAGELTSEVCREMLETLPRGK